MYSAQRGVSEVTTSYEASVNLRTVFAGLPTQTSTSALSYLVGRHHMCHKARTPSFANSIPSSYCSLHIVVVTAHIPTHSFTANPSPLVHKTWPSAGFTTQSQPYSSAHSTAAPTTKASTPTAASSPGAASGIATNARKRTRQSGRNGKESTSRKCGLRDRLLNRRSRRPRRLRERTARGLRGG